MAGEKILVIDDEHQICDLISSYLKKEEFIPLVAHDGKTACEIVEEESPDLIILDFMLPDVEGPELCLKIRKNSNVPVLFLSCRAEEIDKIVSLSSGADDYITKPFLPGELIARIKANLRRYHIQKEPVANESKVITAGALTIDSQLRIVQLSGKEIKLTAKEFDILLYLAEHPKRIFSADQLFKIIWQSASLTTDSKTVTVHISAIRKKLAASNEEYIVNIRRIGYQFNHKLITR